MDLKVVFLRVWAYPARQARAYWGFSGQFDCFWGRFSRYQAGIATISPLIPTKATMRLML